MGIKPKFDIGDFVIAEKGMEVKKPHLKQYLVGDQSIWRETTRGKLKQQLGYEKGTKLKITSTATTGDAFNGFWWGETKDNYIVFINQDDFRLLK